MEVSTFAVLIVEPSNRLVAVPPTVTVAAAEVVVL